MRYVSGERSSKGTPPASPLLGRGGGGAAAASCPDLALPLSPAGNFPKCIRMKRPSSSPGLLSSSFADGLGRGGGKVSGRGGWSVTLECKADSAGGLPARSLPCHAGQPRRMSSGKKEGRHPPTPAGIPYAHSSLAAR